MPRPAAVIAALVAAAASASAAKVGYFESSSCPDPGGFESCYKKAEETWVECVKDKCEDQNVDCLSLCGCVKNLDQLDCAGQSCWNQVYSCSYQETVVDLMANCPDPKNDRIPFWPPPDNAGAGCSCSGGGRLLISQPRNLDGGGIPANSTGTPHNTGTITSPVGGATYSYSYFDNVMRIITVASADARPTGTGGADNGDGDDAIGNSSSSNESTESSGSGGGGSEDGDGGSGAGSLSPWLMLATWPLAGMAMVLVWL